MGVRYSKSIRINDFLKINISRSGVSATVGKKGASISLGSNGTYLNLSPALAGIKGTGVRYRKKIGEGTGHSANKRVENNRCSVVKKTGKDLAELEKKKTSDTSVFDRYREEQEVKINIHKYTDNVLSKEEFDSNISNLKSETSREVYQHSIDGDEDTIESLIGSFMNSIELTYEVNVNYELEEHVLYVDLDLPEIESLNREYPALSRNEIVYKKKSTTELKEEYRNLVLSIGVYLSANFFNISSFIETVVISAFTQRRNRDGDSVDEYIYSVKYTRDLFERTDLSELEDLYGFLCKFENRINPSADGTLKAIKPYEKESVVKANAMVEDALAGLKELGYKTEVINSIRDELCSMNLNSSAEYLKAGLKILSK